MSSGGKQECYASCPASTVTIQPPPFVLTIPGPSLCCPDKPFGIEQHNPCAVSGGHSGGGNHEAISHGDSSGSHIPSFYTRRALPSSLYSYRTNYQFY
uniref:Uncharacterized protein n=1 Tax=Sphenodon punctatus TaxID=8508 RepID=A0A8D0L8L3_SPHPU